MAVVAKPAAIPRKFGQAQFSPVGLPSPAAHRQGRGTLHHGSKAGSSVPKTYDLRCGPHDVGEDREMFDLFNMGRV